MVPKRRGAENDALSLTDSQNSQNMDAIEEVWSSLPATVKTGLLAFLRSLAK
jgi:hypothetical protein